MRLIDLKITDAPTGTGVPQTPGSLKNQVFPVPETGK